MGNSGKFSAEVTHFFSLQYVPQDMITTDMNGVEVINEEPEYNKADYYN